LLKLVRSGAAKALVAAGIQIQFDIGALAKAALTCSRASAGANLSSSAK